MQVGGVPGIRRWAAPVALAVAAAAAVVVTALVLFPEGSPDLDEVGYLSQAEAARARTLTLSAADHDPYLRPFLSGISEGRVVFKYQPAWPALLGLVRNLTGSFRPTIVLTALATVAGLWWLAVEVTRSRRTALIASVLLIASPLFLVQTATYLAHAPSLAVLLVAAAAAVRADRTGSPRCLVLSGAALGLGFFHRSFDAVVWGLPLAGFLLGTATGARPRLRRLLLVAGGALPFLLLLLAYNQRVMGSPFTAPFESTGPLDRFGFGWRASFVTPGHPEYQLHYTPSRALDTGRAYLWQLGRWVTGGWLLIAAAGYGAWRGRRQPAVRTLVALTLSLPIGYLFWWGTGNSVLFGLHRLLGPLYWYPLLAPLAILGAMGLERVAELVSPRVGRVAGPVLLATLLLVTAGTAPTLLEPARDAGAERRDEVARYRVAERPSLVITHPANPGEPYVRAVVLPDPDAPHLVTLLPSDTDGPWRLLDRYPGRATYDIRARHEIDDPFGPPGLHRVRVDVTSGSGLVVALEATAPGAATRVDRYVRVGTRVRTRTLGSAGAGEQLAVEQSFSAGDAALGRHRDGEAFTIAVGVAFTPAADRQPARYEYRWWARLRTAADGRRVLDVLDPPEGFRRYDFPNGAGAWVAEDIDDVLRVSGT